MKRSGPALHWLITLALGAFISAAPAGVQSQNSMPQDRDDLSQRQMSDFDHFLDSHPELAEQLRKDPSLVNNEEFVENHSDLQSYLRQHPEVREDLSQNPGAVMHQEQRYDRREDANRDRDQDRDRRDRDINQRELSNMDAFLDQHPEIAEQVRKDPTLINNKDFVEDHPALREFLASHPGVGEEVKENPNTFMNQEKRFDQREDRRDARPDRDLNRQELANMDRFMDSHPEIAEQLRKDPTLVDNKDFVKSHPALQEFLATHPGVREEYKENPSAFMNQEQRFDQRQDRPDRDVNRQELANMDHFMDSHPEIAEQLRKDPTLVDNKNFVKGHPALQEFLASHPGVREEYKENPTAFMHQEQQFDRASGMRGDRDVTRGELSSFHEFLEGHGSISGELSKNPSLSTNEEYLENHPALRDYLKSHPKVHEELGENPQSFLKSAQQFESTSKAMPRPIADPKMK